jgi:hypothetical protein
MPKEQNIHGQRRLVGSKTHSNQNSAQKVQQRKDTWEVPER